MPCLRVGGHQAKGGKKGEALTPDEGHPGDRLGQLEADFPYICGPFASPDAKELCYIALEDFASLADLFLQVFTGLRSPNSIVPLPYCNASIYLQRQTDISTLYSWRSILQDSHHLASQSEVD